MLRFRIINLEAIGAIEHAIGYRFSKKEVDKFLRVYEKDGPPQWLVQKEKETSRRKKEGQGPCRLQQQISSHEAASACG